MGLSGGMGQDQQKGTQAIAGREVTPEERVRRIQDQMEQYVDLVRNKAPTEEIQQAGEKLSREIGKDSFEAFKRQLPQQLRVRRSLDAQRTYDHFRLPGRNRIVHDRRGSKEKRSDQMRMRDRMRRAAARRLPARVAERLHVRDGKLIRERERSYVNYLAERMPYGAEARKSTIAVQVDRLLSAFEKLIVRRFEGDRPVAKSLTEGQPTFLKKTDAQWKQFFARFADRILKKRVPTNAIRQFVLRGLVPKGAKGVVISDMTLASGRVERFIRFSILAEAMAKMQKMPPGQRFGKEMLTGEELYYLALAAARGREFRGTPKPTEGLFMGGVAEEKAAQELGIPFVLRTQQREKAERRSGRGGGALSGWGREREPLAEEPPYQFIPWWHWGNLMRPGKFKMVTVAFYIGLGLLAVIGILAVTSYLLK